MRLISGVLLCWMLLGLTALWTAIAWLFVVSSWNPESFLLMHSRLYRRSFHPMLSINTPLAIFWCTQTLFLVTCIYAMHRGKVRIAWLMLVAPIIVIILMAVSSDWKDPDWIQICSVCWIAWMIGNAVGIYGLIRGQFSEPRLEASSIFDDARSGETSSEDNEIDDNPYHVR